MDNICGAQREGYTCTLAPHADTIDHTEIRERSGGIVYTAAFWGSTITNTGKVTALYPPRTPEPVRTDAEIVQDEQDRIYRHLEAEDAHERLLYDFHHQVEDSDEAIG